MPAFSHPTDAMQSGPLECSRPFHKRPPRFHRTSESSIFIASFSFSFATHRSPCCHDDSPWPLSDMDALHSNLQCPECVPSRSGWRSCKWHGSTSPFLLLRCKVTKCFETIIPQLYSKPSPSVSAAMTTWLSIQCLLRGAALVWRLGSLFGASPAQTDDWTIANLPSS